MYKVLPEGGQSESTEEDAAANLEGGVGGVNVYREKEKVGFPAHPCLTNSRGDSSIQGECF